MTAALTVYHGKVVQAGGWLTSKVWVLQDNKAWNKSLLPCLLLLLFNLLTVTAGVANVGCASDIVKIYGWKQWVTVSSATGQHSR